MSAEKNFYTQGMMDISSYRFEIADPWDRAWVDLLDISPQSSIFVDPDFLAVFKDQIEALYCFKNNEKLAGIVYIPGGKNQTVRNFCIYNGILFGRLNRDQNEAQHVSERFRITCAAIEYLTKSEKTFSLGLHYNFDDLRPFLWHGYGDPNIQKFQTALRYTSHIDITNLTEGEEKFMAAMNSSRRQELKKSIKAEEVVSLSDDFQAFVDLYKDNFEAQGQKPDAEDLKALKDIMQSLQRGRKGQLFACAPQDKSQVLSMAFFARHKDECCYLYGANAPERLSSSAGTRVVYEALKYYAQGGCKVVDMEGINSPKRGFFKLSFGGDVKPYHQILYG